MSAEPSSSPLWWWVGGAFALLLAAWIGFFIIAARHRVEEVPLAPHAEPPPAARP